MSFFCEEHQMVHTDGVCPTGWRPVVGLPYFTQDEQDLIDIIAIYKGRGGRCHNVLEDYNIDDDDMDFYIMGEHQADPIGVGIMQALKLVPIERRESVVRGYPCDWDPDE